MNIHRRNGTLLVSGLDELNAANAGSLISRIRDALALNLDQVEVDMSQIDFVDGHGIGALASLYLSAGRQCAGKTVTLRLVGPKPSVQQVLELTRLHQIFEIVPQNKAIANGCHPDTEEVSGFAAACGSG